jgi:hypothetical protein
MSNDDASNQRYVFDIYNLVGNCAISNTRNQPILDNPKRYTVAIESFVLTSSESFANTAKIIFETSTLPVVQTALASNSNLQRKVIGEYYLTRDESDAKNNYARFSRDTYHEYNLDSDAPMRTIDLFVYKQSLQGVITPVKVDLTTGLSLTLIFLKQT